MVFPLRERPVTIGRDRSSTIRVDDSKVSRHHTVIEERNGRWVVRDLGSTNRTYVNGEPITEAALSDGDEIQVGPLVMQLTATGVAASPSAAEELPLDDVSLEMDAASIQKELRSSEGQSLDAALYQIASHAELGQGPGQFVLHAGAVAAATLQASAWAWIEWPDGLNGPMKVTGERNKRPLHPTELEVSRSLIDQVTQGNTGLVSTDLGSDFEHSLIVQTQRIASAIAVPLRSGPELRAVLYLDRLEGAADYNREELGRLAILGSRMAMQVEHITLFAELQEAYEQLSASQTELVKTEKQAAIGRLASGFAHDLNNPLASLLCFLELAERALPSDADGPPDKVRNYIAKAAGAANYCRTLSMNLLAFARQRSFDSDNPPEKFSVKDTIQLTVDFCQSALNRAAATTTIDVDENLVLVGDPSTLQQLIVNLVTNAADALEEAKVSGERKISITATAAAPGVHIVVTDNGPGIPPAIAERVFEPLFTTKDKDRGTGLGLFVVRRIVEDCGGKLAFHTPSSGGTIFNILLPETLGRFAVEGEPESDSTLADVPALEPTP